MDYSNISTLLSQLKGQAAYTEQNAGSVTGKQMQTVETLLKNLEPGQIFSGEITDIRGAYITIALQNMQSVQARMAENFEFLIGQKALFQVKDNQENQLLIRPLALDAAQSGELMVAGRALEAAGIQMTEKTLELVKNLMAASQPIDKQSILSYVRQLAKFPQAEAADLISLHKYQIEVNEENLNQFSNYKQFEHSLLKDIEALEQKLPQAVQQIAAGMPEKAEAFVKELFTILYPEEAAVEMTKESGEPGPVIQQDLAKDADAKTQTLTEARTEEGLPVSVKGETQSAEAPGDTAQLATRLKELSSQLTQKDWKAGGEELLRSALEDNFLLKPEEVADKERVKQFYKEAAEKSEKLKALVSSFGKEAAQLEKPLQNMNQNLRFMQSLNEMFTYIQLPLKLSEEQAHGDLYVYTKKKARGNAEDGVSALLHLDMEHLGAVDVLVRLKEQRVTTNFTLETIELLDFIEQHMELLTERLEKKGYSCQTQVELKNQVEQQKSFEQLLTGEAEVYSDRKRFSFDVRA